MKDIDTKRPRRLDLNAPLLSTRRSNLASAASLLKLSRVGSLRGSSNRVPFSWEQSPGKPKDALTSDEDGVEDSNKVVLPLPKPPLIRWQHDNGDCNNNNKDGDDDDGGGSSFSDAIDLLSLVESLNTSERQELESDLNGDNGSMSSPNFMIQRFLPAATALAASSLSALAAANKDKNHYHPNSSSGGSNKNYSNSNHFREASCVPRVVTGEAYSSSKGCGFQFFFPWRTKHRLCGVKSPVRRVHTTLKPQVSPRDNK